MPTITIAMATYKDVVGVIDTIQHSRICREPVDEYIVFDNDSNPLKKESEGLANLSANTGMRLYSDPTITGTSASRNQAVRLATSEIVVVLDCHVFLAPGAVEAVKRYFADPDNRKNILSGPILFDGLDPVHAPTHFQPQFNAGMYGRWGAVWKTPKGDKFTVLEHLDDNTCNFKGFAGSLTLPDAPDFPFPEQLGYGGHEKSLRATGCKPWMETAAPNDTIEIPGQGLGCFAVWRENWLGFHESANGFGGEELCVHELYRQNGGKAVCLAAFQWWHRFYRTGDGGAPYAAENWRKVRNYVLWFQRLGLPLDDVREHFVTGRQPVMSLVEWNRLVVDAVGYTPTPQAAPTVRNFGLPQPPESEAQTLEDVQKWLTTQNRDLNQHIPLLSNLAGQCKAVAEFSIRRDSLVALASCVGSIHSYNNEGLDQIGQTLAEINIRTTTTGRMRALHRTENGAERSLTTTLPEPVDLLFLNTVHTGERVMAELNRHSPQVRRWVAIHSTEIYGAQGDGGSGLWASLEGWLTINPEWFVYLHTNSQYGLTVLGRLPSDKPNRIIPLSPAGVGTELKAILAGLGVSLKAACSCNATIRSMDLLGSAACRQQLDYFTQHLREQQAKWGIEAGLNADGVMAKLQTAWTGAKTLAGWGLAWKMLLGGTPDPIPVILKLAISRAEARGL